MVASRWCWVADGGAALLGSAIAGFHGGAVLGNAIAVFHGGAVFLRSGQTHCKGGFHWVADGGAVLLWNAIAGFHRGAVLLGNVIAGGQAHCNGGFQAALGCRWWGAVI